MAARTTLGHADGMTAFARLAWVVVALLVVALVATLVLEGVA
jgi:hypothetical protein